LSKRDWWRGEGEQDQQNHTRNEGKICVDARHGFPPGTINRPLSSAAEFANLLVPTNTSHQGFT
jgi:hypothetical protein